MAIANENYDVGGTGGAIFAANPPGGPPAGARRAAPQPTPGQEAVGDTYQAPKGLPEWKQPSYDEDDRVDPDKYRDQTTTFLSRFFPDPVSQGLALAKGFYLFFFAAFGSLFPLMAVYFKQLGMHSGQTGVLIGIRPIIEYLATPFWNKMADRFQKGKIMLIVALVSWIIFTLPIGFVRPPVVSCKKCHNATTCLFDENFRDVFGKRTKREISIHDDQPPFPSYDKVLTPDTVEELPRALPIHEYKEQDRHKREAYDHQWAPGYVVGTSPQVVVTNGKQHYSWITPTFSNEVFEREGVQKVFFFLLLLVIIGEFFSSPAIALADSAVITLLGEENQDKYGSQRVFGSIGWGFTMFIMGMVLDHSRLVTSKCDVNDAQKNYHVCFSVFAFLMFCALIVATQIPFRYSVVASNNIKMNDMQQPNGNAQQKKEQNQKESLKNMAEKTKVFAQQLRSLPEFNAVFRAMANLRLLVFMLVAWVMGIGVGLIFTFLFWHLQDFGGGPTLFGIASVINHLSEMVAYFYTFNFITKYGHIKILAAGLLCNCVRFLYISWITWPWLVLPFEFVQGITHAAVWAACCSFIAHNTDAELRHSAQGVLQGVYHGFGKFCGSVFGGMLIESKGTVAVFRAYGVVCLVFLVIFVAVNFATKDEGKAGDDVNPEDILGDASHLAPHGVPSAPMPRALSSSKLDNQDQQEQDNSGPNLGVPGSAAAANNPFLQEAGHYSATGTRLEGGADEQQYYGRGYSQAQSGYSSSGFGLQ